MVKRDRGEHYVALGNRVSLEQSEGDDITHVVSDIRKFCPILLGVDDVRNMGMVGSDARRALGVLKLESDCDRDRGRYLGDSGMGIPSISYNSPCSFAITALASEGEKSV